jgi:xanthine dehydrogenase accessory factor
MDSFAKNTHKRIDTIRVEATVVVRGGGDVVSGTIQRLHRSGFKVLVLELPQPLVVRRTVAFAQAVVDGRITVEDTTAVKIQSLEEAASIWRQGHVPVLVDPDGGSIAGCSRMSLLTVQWPSETRACTAAWRQ